MTGRIVISPLATFNDAQRSRLNLIDIPSLLLKRDGLLVSQCGIEGCFNLEFLLPIQLVSNRFTVQLSLYSVTEGTLPSCHPIDIPRFKQEVKQLIIKSNPPDLSDEANRSNQLTAIANHWTNWIWKKLLEWIRFQISEAPFSPPLLPSHPILLVRFEQGSVLKLVPRIISKRFIIFLHNF